MHTGDRGYFAAQTGTAVFTCIGSTIGWTGTAAAPGVVGSTIVKVTTVAAPGSVSTNRAVNTGCPRSVEVTTVAGTPLTVRPFSCAPVVA